jgi:MoaA/NifB/PqqE/SkfB family radical SAM enzyme
MTRSSLGAVPFETKWRRTLWPIADRAHGAAEIAAADILDIELDRIVVDEGIRRGANYERVMANIALINRYARERGVDRTKMWTVVQQANLHELEALVDLGAHLGFSNQVFSLELTDFGLARWQRDQRGRERRTEARYRFSAGPRRTRQANAACGCGSGTRPRNTRPIARGAVPVAVRARLYFVRPARGAMLLYRQSGRCRDRHHTGKARKLRFGLVR